MKAKLYSISPGPPTFSSLEEERRHRKERLAAAFRLFARFGFENGIAGHMTVRDPEYPDLFWMNEFGMHFSRVSVSNLLLVNSKGELIEGNGVVGGAQLVIHSQIHKARPDVQAIVHLHSTYGMAWSALGRKLDPITQDACAFYQDHEVFKGFSGVVLDYEEGARMAQTLGNKKGLILENHGLLTVGKTVDEAAWWFISMERCCQVQLLAEAAGKPKKIDEQVALETKEKVGSSENGWFNFQPLWDWIIREEPDLLK